MFNKKKKLVCWRDVGSGEGAEISYYDEVLDHNPL
jgi:hypothetical protein